MATSASRSTLGTCTASVRPSSLQPSRLVLRHTLRFVVVVVVYGCVVMQFVLMTETRWDLSQRLHGCSPFLKRKWWDSSLFSSWNEPGPTIRTEKKEFECTSRSTRDRKDSFQFSGTHTHTQTWVLRSGEGRISSKRLQEWNEVWGGEGTLAGSQNHGEPSTWHPERYVWQMEAVRTPVTSNDILGKGQGLIADVKWKQPSLKRPEVQVQVQIRDSLLLQLYDGCV